MRPHVAIFLSVILLSENPMTDERNHEIRETHEINHEWHE
jgi:hypothetical protein